MKTRKRDKIFFALCAVVLIAAAVFMFVGSRKMVPAVEHERFPIAITYQRGDEVITETPIYVCDYLSGGIWSGYFEDSGDIWCIYGEESNYDSWAIELTIEAGYLMGEADDANLYAQGLPEPTFTIYEYESGLERGGLTEIEEHGLRIIDCQIPRPIENTYVDRGITLDERACVVLAALAMIPLLLSLVLIQTQPGARDKEYAGVCRLFNVILGVFGVPLMTVLCMDWEGFDQTTRVLVRLIPAVTAVGVCASVVLRRKGKPAAMWVQFTGPALFLMTIVFVMSVGISFHALLLPAGVLVGILIALLSKKREGVVPTGLDRLGVATNILLVPVYIFMSIPSIVLGAITETAQNAGSLQAVVAFVLSVVIAAAPVYCGIALGLSVAWRKKGKSRSAFLVQFAGFAGIAFSFAVVMLTELLPWISITIN